MELVANPSSVLTDVEAHIAFLGDRRFAGISTLGCHIESLVIADEALESLLKTQWDSENEHKVQDQRAYTISFRAMAWGNFGRLSRSFKLFSCESAVEAYRVPLIIPDDFLTSVNNYGPLTAIFNKSY